MNLKNYSWLFAFIFPTLLGAQELEVGAVYEANAIYRLSPIDGSKEVEFRKGTKVYILELERDPNGPVKSVTFIGVPWKSLPEPSVYKKNIGTLWIKRDNNDYEEDLIRYENNKAIVDKRFSLSLAEFVIKFKKIEETDLKSKLNIGVLYQPIKLRVSREFSYETNVNFSASLAYTPWPASNNWKFLSFVIAPGVTSVSLNPQNSNFFAQSQDIDEVTIPAFTFGMGLLLDASGAQFSVMMGADYLSYNKSIYGWNSQGAMWLSFGIGYNIFKASQPSEPITQ